MRSLTLIFLAVFQFSSFTWSQTEISPSDACKLAEIQFWSRYGKLTDKYERLTSATVSKENEPSWSWGRKKQAVYLLHGFIGTPNEMDEIAGLLRQQKYTVINDIIPGYGLNGFVANQFSEISWKNHVKANIDAIRTCFDKIHFIGFSTGGLLIHDYLRKNADHFQAQSVTLYSPFYKPHSDFGSLLGQAARLLTPVVLTKPLYFLTHFPDIKVAVVKPENYLQQLPLDAAHFVMKMGQQVFNQSQKSPLHDQQTPVLVFVSKFDKIMGFEDTLQIMNQDFPNAEVFEFTEEYAPHHLMVSAVHKNTEFVFDETLKFILKNK